MATKSFSVAMKGFLQDELAISVGLCSAKYTESARIHQHSVEVELALAYPLSLIGLNYTWNSAACGGPAPLGIPRIPSMYSVVIAYFHSYAIAITHLDAPGGWCLRHISPRSVAKSGMCVSNCSSRRPIDSPSQCTEQLVLCAERIIVTPIEAVQARHRKFRVAVAYQAGETVLRHGH